MFTKQACRLLLLMIMQAYVNQRKACRSSELLDRGTGSQGYLKVGTPRTLAFTLAWRVRAWRVINAIPTYVKYSEHFKCVIEETRFDRYTYIHGQHGQHELYLGAIAIVFISKMNIRTAIRLLVLDGGGSFPT